MADLRALSSSVYTQARGSVQGQGQGQGQAGAAALADLASPLPARTELLESVGMFVMQLLG